MTYQISYQLYSSRNFPPLPAQFPALKAMGYDAVEPWLPAYEADPKLFRRQLDDAGLRCLGFHMPLTGLVNEPERFFDIAEVLGTNLLIPPYVKPEERGTTVDDWKSLGAALAEGAHRASKRGLRVAWHNHDFEFAALEDGTRPIDHILGADPAVLFEIDCGWIARAGGDPASELKKFASQIVAVQVKDVAPHGTETDDGWAATGDGIIEWPALLGHIRKTNADHIVVEHDNPSDWKRFAQRSIDYIRREFA
ncbi:sugar phosphate isomerase/epimerase family protein (plasmid) [Agrobacterium sp. rho-8.1]|nr:sugar phosphate isomerase/epimerase [Agrobacterium sp. rho-8.1]